MLQLPDKNFSATTQLLAVIGDPIGHSMSPKMHNAALKNQSLDYVYVAFHVLQSQLKQAVDGFRALGIRGVNVTIPHKVAIMKYLDHVEQTAANIGAVNTIINQNGKLSGHNTDGQGAIKALNDNGIQLQGKKALLLGAGGSAKAIAFNLCKEIDELIIVKREHNFIQAEHLVTSLKQHYDLPIRAMKASSNGIKEEFNRNDIIINATPVGMSPHPGISPVAKELISPHHLTFDLVYNPLETEFLRSAREQGATTLSGIEMLVNQGAIAYEMWTGKFPDTAIMRNAILKHLEGKNPE